MSAELIGTSSQTLRRGSGRTARLDLVRDRLGASCLVEIDGEIVMHSIHGDAEPHVVHAILDRDPAHLHATTIRRSILGQIDAEPVWKLERADGGMTLSVPIRSTSENSLLWVVLPRGAAVPKVWDLQSAACAAAVNEPPTESLASQVEAWLHGTASGRTAGPLLVGNASRVWVAAAHNPARTSLDLIRTATTLHPRHDATVLFAESGDYAYLVFATSTKLSDADVVAVVRGWVTSATRRLGASPTVGVSTGRPVPADLSISRAQAQAAARAAAPGTCASIVDVRTKVVFDHLRDSLSQLPDLGTDPATRLVEYDAKRGTDLAATLLCWLAVGKDTAAAAQRLGVHVNTMRYRLRRAAEIAGVCIDDPFVQTEIHLRLATL